MYRVHSDLVDYVYSMRQILNTTLFEDCGIGSCVFQGSHACIGTSSHYLNEHAV